MMTSISAIHTFGIQATVAQLHHCTQIGDFSKILADAPHALVLGGGSNIIFGGHATGSIIKNNIEGIEIQDENSHDIYIRYGAGIPWSSVIDYAIAHDYGGIENLSLIPGTIGAAPIQNIGAYGVELKDVFHSLTALDRQSGSLINFSNADCAFGYRDSIFKQAAKGKYIITSVVLRLTKGHHVIHDQYGAIKQTLVEKSITTPTIRDISQAVSDIRQHKLPDPTRIGNAGSFFKNPIIPTSLYKMLLKRYPTMPSYPVSETEVKVPAGWLIDQAGWKGRNEGGAAVHDRQALVLVNKNNATLDDLISLYTSIQDDIKQRYSIDLHREVTIYKDGIELIDE